MRIVTKTTRRLIALTAAYAVALQAALAGVALLAAPAQAAAPQICAAVGHDPQSGSIPSGSDCAACPALCGGGPGGVAPGGFTVVAPGAAAFALERRIVPATPWRAQRLLPPSRAPPAA
jgi:hypothetical protein